MADWDICEKTVRSKNTQRCAEQRNPKEVQRQRPTVLIQCVEKNFTGQMNVIPDLILLANLCREMGIGDHLETSFKKYQDLS